MTAISTFSDPFLQSSVGRVSPFTLHNLSSTPSNHLLQAPASHLRFKRFSFCFVPCAVRLFFAPLLGVVVRLQTDRRDEASRALPQPTDLGVVSSGHGHLLPAGELNELRQLIGLQLQDVRVLPFKQASFPSNKLPSLQTSFPSNKLPFKQVGGVYVMLARLSCLLLHSTGSPTILLVHVLSAPAPLFSLLASYFAL